MLQRGINIMVNQVKTPIDTKLFWKSVLWKFDIWDSSLVVFRVVSPLWIISMLLKKVIVSLPCNKSRTTLQSYLGHKHLLQCHNCEGKDDNSTKFNLCGSA